MVSAFRLTGQALQIRKHRQVHTRKVVSAAGNCTELCIRASREEYPRNCRKTIPGGIAFAVRDTDAGRERHRRRFDFYCVGYM